MQDGLKQTKCSFGGDFVTLIFFKFEFQNVATVLIKVIFLNNLQISLSLLLRIRSAIIEIICVIFLRFCRY